MSLESKDAIFANRIMMSNEETSQFMGQAHSTSREFWRAILPLELQKYTLWSKCRILLQWHALQLKLFATNSYPLKHRFLRVHLCTIKSLLRCNDVKQEIIPCIQFTRQTKLVCTILGHWCLCCSLKRSKTWPLDIFQGTSGWFSFQEYAMLALRNPNQTSSRCSRFSRTLV